MEDPGAPALRFIDAMEERMVQWMRDRETIKSPLVTYRAQTTALEDMIRNEFARIPPNPSPQDYSAATKNTINFGAQLRDLQLKHDATIDDAESNYVLALYAHIKTFYTHMFNVMELGALEELFEEYKQNVSKESKPPPKNLPVAGESTEEESTQLQENALPEESVQLDEATEPQEPPQPQETTQRDESTQLAIDHTPTHPDVQVPDTSEQEPDVNMQETDPQELDEVQPRPTPASPAKRRRSAVADSHEPSKRARTGRTRPSDSERVIDFDDVFQNGKAATKHIIVNNNGEWYILVCEEHDMVFTTNRPTRGAGVHLDSEAHGRMGRSEQQAIDRLGIRVRDCNTSRANRNNEVTREAFKHGHQNPKKARVFQRELSQHSDDSDAFRPTRSSRNEESSNANSTSRRTRGEFVGVVDPIPGEIYLGYYNQWYAVLVLPSVAVEGAVYTGLPGTIQDKDMDFMDDVPQCFVVDPDTGALKWQKGYEDGGKSVTERQFPAVFFDVADFSNKNSIAWLPAKDLRAMDVHGPELKLVPNSKSVLKYLETRSNNKTDEARAEIPEPMDLEDRPRDTSAVNMGNCEDITNEANQPTQEQDGKSGCVPPDMDQNDSREDDQGEHEDLSSSPLPPLMEMSPPESPPRSDWAPELTDDRSDPLPNDVPLSYKNVESLPEAREVSEGTSIGGLFRSFTNEDDFGYEPKLDQPKFQGYQAPSVVSISSGSSSRSSSAPPAEAPPPPISAVPEMATVPSAPPVPVKGNQEKGQPALTNHTHLIQAARETLKMGGLSSEDNFQSSRPGDRVYSAAATSPPGAPETRKEPVNQQPIQRTLLKAPPRAAQEQVVVTQVTVQPPKTYDEFFANTAGGRKGDATTAAPIPRHQTSVHRKKSISIHTAATVHQNIQLGPHPPPGFLPARRPGFFLPSPKELNASLMSPTTNRLPPLNPGPPDHSMPVSFSQPPLPGFTPVMNYAAPLLRPDVGSRPTPQLPFPNMQAGPGQHPRSFHNQPLNGQQLKASGMAPILPSPTLSPQQSQHGQARQDFPQRHAPPSIEAKFPCPHCPRRAHTRQWLNKHIKDEHPNC
ncbi:hypothetical protein BGZ61DRAFT_483912 [Ilyonectria robusta]|uniref:uncharacterized protein n=1 Tax=Ilyonectria robusta TaxID=1079257 RepID=UPI001E8D7BD2|nr:uncharacterized protein BGZ61DRAFT_483912 [Ilyonectria robusta]KAH8667224.1 hypothetical protein BGZ61DRAFT_483912 [Ilyonectria robusta]